MGPPEHAAAGLVWAREVWTTCACAVWSWPMSSGLNSPSLRAAQQQAFGVSNGLAARAADDGAIPDLRRRAGGPRSRAVTGDRRGAAGYRSRAADQSAAKPGAADAGRGCRGGLGVSTAGAGAIALPRVSSLSTARHPPRSASPATRRAPRSVLQWGRVRQQCRDPEGAAAALGGQRGGFMVLPGWVDRSATPFDRDPALYRQ